MTPLDHAAAAAIDAGHVIHGVDADGAYLGLVPRVQASAVASGPPPDAAWRWQGAGWQPPSPTLAEQRAARWADVKRWRQQAMAGTFICGGLVYDIDPVNITGATVLAMRAQAAGAPFAQVWVLADNTTATLDAAAMCAVGEACAQAVADLWATSTALRAQIDAAETPQNLASVAWPEGVP